MGVDGDAPKEKQRGAGTVGSQWKERGEGGQSEVEREGEGEDSEWVESQNEGD